MIHKKIGAFIFQDVQNPNETKTTAVTLRLYALILSVYFLVLFCVCCFLRDVPFLPADTKKDKIKIAARVQTHVVFVSFGFCTS